MTHPDEEHPYALHSKQLLHKLSADAAAVIVMGGVLGSGFSMMVNSKQDIDSVVDFLEKTIYQMKQRNKAKIIPIRKIEGNNYDSEH